MINKATKLESAVHYIEDTIFVTDLYRDSYGNPIDKRIWNESKPVSEYQTVLFSHLYTERGIAGLSVREKLSALSMINRATTFKRIPDNMIPANTNEYSVQVNGDRAMGILFHESAIGKNIEMDYYASGRVVIGGDNIVLSYTNKGIQLTLEELYRQCKEALDGVIGINDARVFIAQLEAYMKEISKILDDLMLMIPEVREIKEMLDLLIPQAKIVMEELKEAVENVRDLANMIANTGNKPVTIMSTDWEMRDDGKYHVRIQHDLATKTLGVDVTTPTERGWEGVGLGYFLPDNNNIEFISSDNNRYEVSLNARTSSGSMPDPVQLTSDDIREGIENLYLRSETKDIPESTLVAENGLYVTTISHTIGVTSIDGTIRNPQGVELSGSIEVLDNTRVKVYVCDAERLVVKLFKVGVN